MKVFTLAAGFAAGYVLGSRAGRDKYEQIAAAARKAQNHPAVTQVQEKAQQLLSSASAASSTDTSTGSPTTSASPASSPKHRSSRRQSQGSGTVSDVTTDPLA